MRLRFPAIASLLLAGAAAFACGSPSIPEDDPEVPLPDRSVSAPKTGGDASTARDAARPDAAEDVQTQGEGGDASRTLHAFVSSAIVNGALGGVAGADQKCTTLAAAQGLKGVFKAWISVNGTNAADRITSAGPWHLVTGQLVAATKAELVSGQLKRPLNIDEKGVAAPLAEDRVWTGTAANGTFADPECALWSGAGSGRVGEAEFSDGRWTNALTEPCSELNRVYCFEL